MAEAPKDHEADALRSFLIGRDVPCPECRYNLRGLAQSVCPECGSALSVELLTAKPLPETAFALGMVPLMLFLMLSSVLWIGSGWDKFSLVFVGAAGLPLYAWVRHGRWIKTRSIEVRIGLAISCWLWPVLFMNILFSLGFDPGFH